MCLIYTTSCQKRQNRISYCFGGEMSERPKEHAWKACDGETHPGVRIPLSPPVIVFIFGYVDFPLMLQQFQQHSFCLEVEAQVLVLFQKRQGLICSLPNSYTLPQV